VKDHNVGVLSWTQSLLDYSTTITISGDNNFKIIIGNVWVDNIYSLPG